MGDGLAIRPPEVGRLALIARRQPPGEVPDGRRGQQDAPGHGQGRQPVLGEDGYEPIRMGTGRVPEDQPTGGQNKQRSGQAAQGGRAYPRAVYSGGFMRDNGLRLPS